MTEETHAMQYLPNQAPMPTHLLQAHFEWNVPDDINILLCLLDGAERRQRVQAKLKPSAVRHTVKLDLPADVHWVPADQVSDAGADWGGNRRRFESLRKAVEFVMRR